jgi:diacylglycerol O-acyltransferase
MHLIEGLQDGRFAVYTKMHHALVDGVSALKLLQQSLSPDPHESQVRVPWSVPPERQGPKPQRRTPLQQLSRTFGSIAALGPSC